MLPSPATSLARYEEPSRLERITVRHALRAPSPTVPRSATLSEAVRALCAVAWAPLVITAGGEPLGVLTAELLVAQMLGAEPSDALEATG